MLAEKRVLVIIGGGIAAYKSLMLIRLLRQAGASVTPVLISMVSALPGATPKGRMVTTDPLTSKQATTSLPAPSTTVMVPGVGIALPKFVSTKVVASMASLNVMTMDPPACGTMAPVDVVGAPVSTVNERVCVAASTLPARSFSPAAPPLSDSVY